VKLCGLTVTGIVVVAIAEPEAPVIVKVNCPTVAELLAVSVRTLVPVVGLGAKAAVTPLGRPDAENVTLPLNPYCGFT
jgi:hypothetical protein